jgi:hypothetical protein
MLHPNNNTSGSGPLLDGGEGSTSKGLDQERLALLERQAPAFIILDFRWECFAVGILE